jgi:hypothetical protein
MIGRQQQARRIREGAVVRKPFRIGMPVRADDRQIFNELIKIPCNRSGRGIGGEQPIRIEFVYW